MAVSVSWGILFVTDSLQVWHAMLLLSVHGLAGAIWMPAEQLMLHDLAGRETLPSAVRLNSTGRSVGFLAGPAIGSVLLLALGPAVGIFANVLMYLPLSIWLLRTPYTGHIRDGGPSPARVSLFDAARVLREVAGQPVLISMIVLGGMSAFLIGSGIQSQMPEFAEDLGVGDASLAYGLLLAANAAGAVLGGIILEITHAMPISVRSAFIGTLAWALCMFGFALSGSYALSILLLVGAGMANLAAQSIAQTLVQLRAPAASRGRVLGLYNMASSGLRAGSGFSIGIVGGLIGIHWSLAMSAALLTLIVAGLMLFTARATDPAAQPTQELQPTG
jgi:MFS family permease